MERQQELSMHEVATLTIAAAGAVSYHDAMLMSFKEREIWFKTLQKAKGDPNKEYL